MEKDKWVFYKGVDFEDWSIKQYHIDTRDFHCLINRDDYEIKPKNIDLDKIPERCLFTGAELKELLDRYFNESGGDKKWRYFSLDGDAKFRTQGWELKYMRIYRTDKGLIVCSRYSNEECFVMSKGLLSNKVYKEELNAC